MKQGGGPVLVGCTISRRRTRNQMSTKRHFGGVFRDLGLCLNQCSKIGVRKAKLQQRLKGENATSGRGRPVEGRAAQKPKGQASAWPVKGQGREQGRWDRPRLFKERLQANFGKYHGASHSASHIHWFSTILVRIVFFLIYY